MRKFISSRSSRFFNLKLLCWWYAQRWQFDGTVKNLSYIEILDIILQITKKMTNWRKILLIFLVESITFIIKIFIIPYYFHILHNFAEYLHNSVHNNSVHNIFDYKFIWFRFLFNHTKNRYFSSKLKLNLFNLNSLHDYLENLEENIKWGL